MALLFSVYCNDYVELQGMCNYINYSNWILSDRALIIFESIDVQSELSATFTVISPMRGLYLTNCSAMLLESDHYCSGVNLIEGDNAGLDSIYLDPQSCHGIEYGLFGKQCLPVTITTVGQVNTAGSNCNAN